MSIKIVKKVMLSSALFVLIFTASGFSQSQFNPSIQYGSITDERDGRRYRTVRIGNQTWLAENMNWNLPGRSWCYDNNMANCNKYGRLYDYYAALLICPAGFRLPSDEDWYALFRDVGVATAPAMHLKSQIDWPEGEATKGTNLFGFSALPAGLNWHGRFVHIGEFAYWWSNSGMHFGIGYLSDLDYHVVGGLQGATDIGASVRCVR